MTHLPYIAASYGLTLGAILVFGVSTASRLARARRRLTAAETAQRSDTLP